MKNSKNIFLFTLSLLGGLETVSAASATPTDNKTNLRVRKVTGDTGSNIPRPTPVNTQPSNRNVNPTPVDRPSQPSGNSRGNFCCLCDNCQDIVNGRDNWYLNANGLTCSLAYNLLADNQSQLRRSNSCSALQGQYQSKCCNPNHQWQPVPQAPVPAPTINLKPGNWPKCQLCSNNAYPSKGHNFIAVLYHGTRTCRELHDEGQTGNIEDKLCKPLQMFAFDVCGCEG